MERICQMLLTMMIYLFKMKVKDAKIIIKEWKVKSKTNPNNFHIVGWNGRDYWTCNCIAGAFGRDCRHKRIVKNKLKGLIWKN